MADKKSLQEKFDQRCDEARPLWDAGMQDLLKDLPISKREARRAEIATRFAQNAREDVQRLEGDLVRLVALTAAILTATALFFAAAALKPSAKTSAAFLAIALCFAAIAFVAALVPLTPPIRRTLFTPYASRLEFTLLVYDHFTDWVFYCWLAKRRSKVITKYKKAHVVAVCILVAAAVLVAVGSSFNAAG